MSTINKALIHRVLLEKFQSFAEYGFRGSVKGKALIRCPEPGLSQRLFCDLLDYRPKYILEPALSIRIDKVEDIFHRTSGYEKRFHIETPTVSFAFGHLNPELNLFRYEIVELESLESSLVSIMRDFKVFALPFLEANSSTNALDHLLNDSPKDDCPYSRMEDLRCSHGLILAKLNGRPNYAELIEIYRNKLGTFAGGYYLSKFELLVLDLNSE